MSTDIEDRPWDKDVQDIADQLVMGGLEVERGIGYVGDLADLVMTARAERDALRNVVLNYLDDHARLVTNEALRERKRLLLPDELVPCACDICGYAERALSSPERSSSTAAPTHRPHCDGCDYHDAVSCWCPHDATTAAKGGETDG